MSLERRGHPFSGTQATRMDWAEGLNVRTVSDAKEAEVLLWVGCGGALIERNQRVTRATAQLLEQAGVKFAVMGREEKCSGDPARRTAFTSSGVVRDDAGRFAVELSPEARPGNWLMLSGEGPLTLTLRLYDTPLTGSAGGIADAALPNIARQGCRDAKP